MGSLLGLLLVELTQDWDESDLTMSVHIHKSLRFFVNQSISGLQSQSIPLCRHFKFRLVFRFFPWRLFLDVNARDMWVWVFDLQ